MAETEVESLLPSDPVLDQALADDREIARRMRRLYTALTIPPPREPETALEVEGLPLPEREAAQFVCRFMLDVLAEGEDEEEAED